ncbi:hypothetical protein CHH83_02775 [Bacillus sp. 7586-K]|nr:hypothetical protein CHH83_02775 [Bacillus sp. 7586-K]
MDNLEIEKRISKLEEQNISQDRRLKDLEDDTRNVPRLEALMEMVVKTNQEQVKTNREFSNTMKEVNTNIHGLNVEMKNMGKDISALSGRVGDLEEGKKERKKITLDFLLKIAGGVILAAILFYLGLK